MIETLIVIGIGAAILVAGISIYAASRPDMFHIARSATIGAAPDKIFPLIDDLRGFNRWNPFLAKDLAATALSYSGPRSGKGASHAWKGDARTGAGQIEIVESTPPSKVVMKLDMLKPFEAHNRVEFTLEPNGGGTSVTWTMQGKQPFLAKLMTVFVDCDKMVGREFEKGLARLGALAEG